MKFRKKPVVIEAVQWQGDFAVVAETFGFIPIPMSDTDRARYGFALGERHLKITTLEGVMTADPGDWVIKGVKGEFYPCKPAIFEATYESAENVPDYSSDVVPGAAE